MDKIQKALIKAGRKDLAQEYYKKISQNTDTFPCPTCGTKVLENTGYCLKCKKKVTKAAASIPNEREIRNIKNELAAYKKQLENMVKIITLKKTYSRLSKIAK